MSKAINALDLAKQLIKCTTITPDGEEAIDLLISVLDPLGFVCKKIISEDVCSLYAKFGTKNPNICFAGHVDVVPPGDLRLWNNNPFDPIIKDNKLYGRGASDMKAAIACFVSACSKLIMENQISHSLSLMITSDEEGVAENGTIKILEYLQKNNEEIEVCIVGEPTSDKKLGDMVKIGRRGSINFNLIVDGKQGHVAYPELALNPATMIVKILHEIIQIKFDNGNDFFDPTNLEITTIDINNNTTNVIPSQATAKFNIRYNNAHTGEDLEKLIDNICKKYAKYYKLEARKSADPFMSIPHKVRDILPNVIKNITGITAALSTTGGTSDARFITSYCPVIEFGMLNKTAHQINEHIDCQDIKTLTEIYFQLIKELNGKKST